MKLYYNPLSPFSQKVMMGLYEKNVSFEPVLVDVGNLESKAEYRKIYPMGKVPLLVRDDGWMIPESSIILEYIDGAFATGPSLISVDKDLARQTRFYDRMADLYVTDSVAAILFGGMRSSEEKAQSFFQERIKRMKDTLDIAFMQIDKVLEKNTWIMGNDFSMADCALIPGLGYARMAYPFDKYNHIAAYFRRASERPSYKRVMDEAAPMLQALMRK